MWNTRNDVMDARTVALQPAEIPASAITLTDGSGAAMSELTPMYLAGRGHAMVMTTASDYGTLHAAGRPT